MDEVSFSHVKSVAANATSQIRKKYSIVCHQVQGIQNPFEKYAFKRKKLEPVRDEVKTPCNAYKLPPIDVHGNVFVLHRNGNGICS